MKQKYTHIELLALRHECQEPSVKSFFTIYRSYGAYPDLQLGFNSFGLHGHHTNNQSRIPVKYASGLYSEDYACLPQEVLLSPAGSRPELDSSVVRAEISVSKGELPALESFQLVKIPQSFGDLPPGSKIIKVRPGIPVPSNAIPISLAEISGDQCYTSEIFHEKRKAGPNKKQTTRSVKNKKGSDSETLRHNGMTYFAASDEVYYKGSQSPDHKHYTAYNQNYFSPEAGSSNVNTVTGSDPRNGLGTKLGPATIASSETMVSSETKFHYAKFFEPYMKKFSKKNLLRDARGPQATEKNEAAVQIVPSTSNESESATEYSSDSSNIQIQLPA